MKKITKQPFWTSFAVFILLIGIYFLSYSGFPVSDDEQLFAAVSQNLAEGKGMEAPQLYGNDRLVGNYTRSGPLHVLAGAALLGMFSKTGIGQVQLVYLLPPVYTALTAALIVMIVVHYRFSERIAAFTALLFGLSTIAWPYSQMNFREPLAALLLTGAWLAFLIAFNGHTSALRQYCFVFVAAAAFIGALFTKVIILATLPAFLYLLWERRNRISWSKLLIGGVVFMVVVSVIGVIFPQFRISINFFERLWRLRRGFPYGEIPQALFEMLFSPGRGLLVYSPILCVVPIGLYAARDGKRKMVVFGMLAAAGLMLAQAAAYGTEWWGITWGTRSLLPILPLLTVGIAPTVDLLINSNRSYSRRILWFLGGLGVLIQLGGVLVSNSAYTIDLYYNQLVPDIGDVLWSFRHAPLIAHWRLLLQGAEVSPAAARVMTAAPLWVAAIIVSCGVLISWGARALKLILSGKAFQPRKWEIGILVIILAALPVLMLAGFRNDPRFGNDRSDVLALDEVLVEKAKPGDVILVFPYLRTTWNHFMNFYRGDADWYSLPNTFPAGEMSSTMALADGLGGKYYRVWLVTETAAWEPVPPFVEGYLSQFGEVEAMAVFEPVDPNLQLRLLIFDLGNP